MPNQACRTSGIGRNRSCWAGPCHRTRVRIRQPRRRARSRIERFGVSRRCGGFPAYGGLPAMQGCLGAGVPATWVPRKSGGAAMETSAVGHEYDPPGGGRSGRVPRIRGRHVTGRGGTSAWLGLPGAVGQRGSVGNQCGVVQLGGAGLRSRRFQVSPALGSAGSGVGRFWGRPAFGFRRSSGFPVLRIGRSWGLASLGSWPVAGLCGSSGLAGLQFWTSAGLSGLPVFGSASCARLRCGPARRCARPVIPAPRSSRRSSGSRRAEQWPRRRGGPVGAAGRQHPPARGGRARTTAAGPDHHRFVNWPPR